MSDEEWIERQGYAEPPVINAAKRLGVTWAPWMGDWFVAHSPRNNNTHGEGYWEHWVVLALRILADPLTKASWPEAHALVEGFDIPNVYSGCDRPVSIAALRARFEEDES